MTKAVRTFQKSVYFSDTTRRYIPENCYIHIYFYLFNDAASSSDIYSVDTGNE
jgi:hypothetical protein